MPPAGRGPARCRSDAAKCPGGATHFGSGCAAKSRACSASERKALLIDSEIPAARAAAAIRSNAIATSGRIGLPWRYASGPLYPPPLPLAGSAPGIVANVKRSSAVARARTFTRRCLVGARDRHIVLSQRRDRHARRRGAQPELDALDPADRMIDHRDANGRRARTQAIRRGRQVVRIRCAARQHRRLERAREVLGHATGRGGRSDVGGALIMAARRERASVLREQRDAEHREDRPGHQRDRRLTATRDAGASPRHRSLAQQSVDAAERATRELARASPRRRRADARRRRAPARSQAR